jgi:UPF0716 protein FxsA
VPTFLFILLVVVPAIEIASIVLMTSWVGGALTFTLIVIGALVGALVMRYAGRSWWEGLRASAGVPDAAGVSTPPALPDARQFADRGLLFLGGLLIALPGFVGDIIGLLLLLPFVRSGLRVVAAAWFLRRFTSVTGPGGFVVWQQQGRNGRSSPPPTVTVEQVVPGEVLYGEVLPPAASDGGAADREQGPGPGPDSRTAPPQEPRGG